MTSTAQKNLGFIFKDLKIIKSFIKFKETCKSIIVLILSETTGCFSVKEAAAAVWTSRMFVSHDCMNFRLVFTILGKKKHNVDSGGWSRFCSDPCLGVTVSVGLLVGEKPVCIRDIYTFSYPGDAFE